MKKIIFSLVLLLNFALASDDSGAVDFSNEFSEPKTEIFDPLSGYNRVMTSFNDKAYIYVFDPITRGYVKVMPEVARTGVSNFFNNLFFPIRFVNNLLQFKFSNSAEELGRFLINSTFGLLGFMDPATTELHWQAHKEDFGQTLGFYGVGSGFPLVLPLLGPSNLRDTFGMVADGYVSPLNNFGDDTIKYKIPNNTEETSYLAIGRHLNENSFHIGRYQDIKKDAIDLYPFLRDIYEQKREKEIKE
ncbi:VacJ family lipoprotein [Arcobacter sp.]|uniref:MlaA family lipoprotein n=1 Tax=unclassified Arcobacter TaxID=2593671 RepID=UPI003B006393